MKTLFSITYYHPYVSGLTLAAARWAEGLAKAGDEVHVISIQHDKSLPVFSRIRGVRIHRSPWILKLSKGFISFDWLVSSWRHTGQNDVTVVNLPQFEGVIPALFAKLQGKRVIAIYHCEVTLPEGFVNSVIQALLEISHFITLLLSDKVVTYTRDYADHSKVLRLLTVRKQGREIKIIVPPIPKPRENKACTKKLEGKIGDTDVVIGVAARLAAEKGVEYLLDALPIIQKQLAGKKIKIVVAGPMTPVGEDAYKTRIMTLTKKLGKRVVFLGSLNPSDMGSFYALLDVLVLPSVNSTEAFGMVQVEAMLCGVPVVASDLPGVRIPVRRTGMGLLVPPKDSKKLGHAINSIVRNRQKYIRPVERFFLVKQSIDHLRAVIINRNANGLR